MAVARIAKVVTVKASCRLCDEALAGPNGGAYHIEVARWMRLKDESIICGECGTRNAIPKWLKAKNR